MHVETLKTFCDLVETGSLSRAARLNLVSQSAVSQQLRALERRYGRRLIERAPRIGARPTEAGRLLYDEVKPLLERLARARAAAARAAGRGGGDGAGGHGLQRGPAHPAARHQAVPGRPSRGQRAALVPAHQRGVRGLPGRRGRLRHRGGAGAPARSSRSCRSGHDELVIAAPPGHPIARRRPLPARRARRPALHRLRPRHSHPPPGRRPAAPPRRAGQLRHGARQHRDDQAVGRGGPGPLAPARPHAGRRDPRAHAGGPARPPRAPSAGPSG